MTPVLLSCVAGTDPCNDTGSGSVGLEWLEWVGILPVAIVVVMAIWLVVRRARRG